MSRMQVEAFVEELLPITNMIGIITGAVLLMGGIHQIHTAFYAVLGVATLLSGIARAIRTCDHLASFEESFCSSIGVIIHLLLATVCLIGASL